MFKENRDPDDEDFEALTEEEVNTLIDALENYDNVEEELVLMESGDQLENDVARIISIKRIPCTSHKVSSI